MISHKTLLRLALTALVSLTCSLTAECKVIYVRTNGNDGASGLSWSLALKTVTAGLNAAASGDEVWVAAGTYVERITLKPGVGLYGGFAGTEAVREQRNWTTNKSILDGNAGGSVVTSPTGATDSTVIDGFTIRNGKVADGNGGGINCQYMSSPNISHNTITGNTARCGGGIYSDTSSAMISDNTISLNTSSLSNGGGICCSGGSPRICNNAIKGNIATGNSQRGGGVCCFGGVPTIFGNIISSNIAEGGGGIYCSSSTSDIANNVIASNTAVSDDGGGIYCYEGSPKIVNNTVVYNSCSGDYIRCSGGIFFFGGSVAATNNIVAYNSSGIGKYLGNPTLANNDVYGNVHYDYYSGLAPGKGDISADPRIAISSEGVWHISSDSPCRNAGDNTAVDPSVSDIDAQSRIEGGTVDIGADESYGETRNSPVIFVSPTGNDLNNGSTWALAKLTVKAGISAASAGTEIWVAAGTYKESLTLNSGVALYGGFAGNESSKSARNWALRKTILDGNRFSTVVKVATNAVIATRIDGFVITNGKTSSNGGGINCTNAHVTVANNTIYNNTASVYGGGVYCSSISSVFYNNMIYGNKANMGAGMYFDSESSIITNNTVTYNTASMDGGGIYCWASSTDLAISNNIVAFNSSGIKQINGVVKLRSNCVYGNGTNNYSGLLPGTGDISADPLFVSAPTNDYHLTSASPCVNAGENGYVQPDWLDIDTDIRVSGGEVDMGADEFGYESIVPTPGVVPGAGVYNTPLSVTFSEYRPEAIIHYTTNGVEPTETDPIISAGESISFQNDLTIKAKAWITGLAPSKTLSANYVFKAATPKLRPNGNLNIYQQPVNVTITCDTVGAIIRYTTNGLDPTEADPIYVVGSNILVDTCQTVKAKAWFDGWQSSDVASVVYTLTTATPIFTPAGGTFDKAQDVIVTCDTPGADIHYTLNGNTPTIDDPVVAPGSVIHVDRNTPLSAIAYRDGFNKGGVAYAEYIITGKVTAIHVKPDGNDNNDGLSWDSAMKTIGATFKACVPGTEVWVAAGSYNEKLTIKNGVALYGGFSGVESTREQRNWLVNKTILDGNQTFTPVNFTSGATTSTRLDGFTVCNGKTGNFGYGGAINCQSSSPTICNNTITMNTAGAGGGIYTTNGSPVILNNVISSNMSTYSGGAGIYCSGGSPVIAGNLIYANTVSAGSKFGVAISSGSSAAIITNNTIVSHSGSIASILDCNSSSTVISGNIVAFNSAAGISSSKQPILNNNCFFGNKYNYSGISAGATDISVDPLFVDIAGGNYHLKPSSPCINAGLNTAAGLPAADIDGQGRIFGGTVDIGADEYLPTGNMTSIGGAKRGEANSWVEFTGDAVTAKFGDAFYIENEKRTSGIRVEKAGHTLDKSMKAHVFGKIKNNAEGEAYIEAAIAEPIGSEMSVISPLYLSNRFIGGGTFGAQGGTEGSFGLNNIGLLVKTSGKVIRIEPVTPPLLPAWFEIDDGSNAPIKCVVPAGVVIGPAWNYAAVTGISSCENSEDALHSLMRVRSQEDIQGY